MKNFSLLWEMAYLGLMAYSQVCDAEYVKQGEDVLWNYWTRAACPELQERYKRIEARINSRKRLPK